MIVDLGPRRLGWREDGKVVASLAVERDGDEVTIAALDYATEASARALVEALLGVVEARRLVGVHAVLARCGFEREGERFVREVRAVAAEDAEAGAVTLAALEAAIRSGWGPDTSDEPGLWSPENPAIGQCAVTALVVRDQLGGEIVAAGVVRAGRRVGRHAWNRLPSGLAVDLTRDQFRAGERFERPGVPDVLVTDRHPERYELLAARVREALAARTS